MKIVVTSGFEYYGESFGGCWYWFFRPIGAPRFIQFTSEKSLRTRKAELLKFLASSAEALAGYLQKLDRIANVGRIEAALAEAEALRAKAQAPDWDPGGSTNNPARVERATREASTSASTIARLRQELADARALRRMLADKPFDEAAWRAKYLTTFEVTPSEKRVMGNRCPAGNVSAWRPQRSPNRDRTDLQP